ncbi:TolB family protein [Massilia phosphatilytica]
MTLQSDVGALAGHSHAIYIGRAPNTGTTCSASRPHEVSARAARRLCWSRNFICRRSDKSPDECPFCPKKTGTGLPYDGPRRNKLFTFRMPANDSVRRYTSVIPNALPKGTIIMQAITFSRKRLSSIAVWAGAAAAATGAHALNGTLLLNRLAPVSSELYVSNADGSGERKLIATAGYDYHASFSKDGQWIVFTSERDGLGQANIFRVKADGTGLQRLTDHIAVDDAAVFSPTDPNTIAFVSTRKRDRLRHGEYLDAEHRDGRVEKRHRLATLRCRQAARLLPAVLVAGRKTHRVFIGRRHCVAWPQLSCRLGTHA